ncbi:MAG TPA: flavin monoamine oxidase family protein [Mycobacterium sp.]|nr:flavin monoamine oxidase family protein [Mycobacterium sp.]HPZ94285.1 flavin monoamine oxidase family protein [Mycobacterium sp.]
MAYDVVVIGAGLAGLTAARELTGQGFEVVVLEGRDRVGGRTCPATLAGVPVDRGASFVGPTQDAVLKLAADLGCETAPTYNTGANLIRWRGRVHRYQGTIPKLGILGLLDIGRIQWQFERLARDVDITAPWNSKRAAEFDAISLGAWLRSVRATTGSQDLMAIVSRVTWGAEPDDVSLLHALRYVKTSGGLNRMLDTAGGAQQDHFADGSHEMSARIAAELGDRVRLGAVVTRIEWSDDAVAVASSAGTFEARRAIVAVPPAHRLDIDIAPAPPIEYQQLAQRWPQGALTKSYAAYPTPFWRAKGLSGQALSDQGPVFITFDVSPEGGGPGILLGFTDPRGFDALPEEQRREQVLRCFTALFGDEAANPIDYLDQRWGAEEFAPGGPTAAVPPGSWTEFGRLLRTPVGPLHWAGTETADEWTGFMDGAVRSGQRAAAEVSAALRGEGLRK